jgi:glucose-6-phosphate isomerase
LGNIQDRAFEGTLQAHTEVAKNNNVVLELEKMDAWHLGYLFYFFERACGMSAYLNEVNPFNQPGVEIYKKNMFHLLGKPGYEK